MRYHLGKAIVELTDSPYRIAAVVLSCGVGVGLLDYAIHSAALRANASELAKGIFNATIIAFAAAIIVLLVLLSTRERRRRVLDDVRKIAQLNHHIRNALEVVVQSQYVPSSAEQRSAVLASAERIDRTLRELFPIIGEREDEQGGEVAKEARLRLVVPERRHLSS